MNAFPVVDRPAESTWGDLPQAAGVVLVHAEKGVLSTRRPNQAALAWPWQQRQSGESARTNAVRALALETGVTLPSSAIHPLLSQPVQDASGHWYFVDLFWAAWTPALGEPKACQPGIVPEWARMETVLQQSAHPAFDGELVGHLVTQLMQRPLQAA
jgi:ADP-ribose pyrophosphatase YjhB (NUDIX family)